MAAPGRTAVEICVDDVAGAILAEQEGADRIELCAALSEGGLTPSLGLVQGVLGAVHRIGVQVMIRPRGGDFVVDPQELAVMLADIAAIAALRPPAGVAVGFVFGALTGAGAVDAAALASLRHAAGAAPTTFHRAFDSDPDRARALDQLIALGFHRVLTGGGPGSADDNRAGLAALVDQSAGRIVVLAGGGVRPHNVGAILAETGVREVHGRAMEERPGRPPVTTRAAVAALVRAAHAP